MQGSSFPSTATPSRPATEHAQMLQTTTPQQQPASRDPARNGPASYDPPATAQPATTTLRIDTPRAGAAAPALLAIIGHYPIHNC